MSNDNHATLLDRIIKLFRFILSQGHKWHIALAAYPAPVTVRVCVRNLMLVSCAAPRTRYASVYYRWVLRVRSFPCLFLLSLCHLISPLVQGFRKRCRLTLL